MKIKYDFVTTCSTEAFIVSQGKKPVEVAKEMLKVFFRSWKEYNFENNTDLHANHPREKKVMKWVEENLDFEGNIIIPWTTNYPTFIFGGDWIDLAKGRAVIVQTCNNENWAEAELKIHSFLDPNYDDNLIVETDQFLDLGDFEFKTRAQFDGEESKKLDEKIKRYQKPEGKNES